MKTTKLISGTEKTLKKAHLLTKTMYNSMVTGLNEYKKDKKQIDLEVEQKYIHSEHARLKRQHTEVLELRDELRELANTLNGLNNQFRTYDQKVFRMNAEFKQLEKTLKAMSYEDPKYQALLDEKDELEYQLKFRTNKLEEAKAKKEKEEELYKDKGLQYEKLLKKHNKEWTDFQDRNAQIFKTNLTKVEKSNEITLEKTEEFEYVLNDTSNNVYHIEDVPVVQKEKRSMSFITHNPATRARLGKINSEEVNNNLILEVLDISEKFKLKLPGLEIRKDKEVVSCHYEYFMLVSYNKDEDVLQLCDVIWNDVTGDVEGLEKVATGNGQNLNSLVWMTDDEEKMELFSRSLTNLYEDIIRAKSEFKECGEVIYQDVD